MLIKPIQNSIECLNVQRHFLYYSCQPEDRIVNPTHIVIQRDILILAIICWIQMFWVNL